MPVKEKNSPEVARTLLIQERLTNILALLLVKGEPPNDQLIILSSLGYSNNEIAKLLNIKPNSVKVALFRIRKQK